MMACNGCNFKFSTIPHSKNMKSFRAEWKGGYQYKYSKQRILETKEKLHDRILTRYQGDSSKRRSVKDKIKEKL